MSSSRVNNDEETTKSTPITIKRKIHNDETPIPDNIFVHKFDPNIREHQYNLIKNFIKNVQANKGKKLIERILVVHGKPGTGKTALINYLCNEAEKVNNKFKFIYANGLDFKYDNNVTINLAVGLQKFLYNLESICTDLSLFEPKFQKFEHKNLSRKLLSISEKSKSGDGYVIIIDEMDYILEVKYIIQKRDSTAVKSKLDCLHLILHMCEKYLECASLIFLTNDENIIELINEILRTDEELDKENINTLNNTKNRSLQIIPEQSVKSVLFQSYTYDELCKILLECGVAVDENYEIQLGVRKLVMNNKDCRQVIDFVKRYYNSKFTTIYSTPKKKRSLIDKQELDTNKNNQEVEIENINKMLANTIDSKVKSLVDTIAELPLSKQIVVILIYTLTMNKVDIKLTTKNIYEKYLEICKSLKQQIVNYIDFMDDLKSFVKLSLIEIIPAKINNDELTPKQRSTSRRKKNISPIKTSNSNQTLISDYFVNNNCVEIPLTSSELILIYKKLQNIIPIAKHIII